MTLEEDCLHASKGVGIATPKQLLRHARIRACGYYNNLTDVWPNVDHFITEQITTKNFKNIQLCLTSFELVLKLAYALQQTVKPSLVVTRFFLRNCLTPRNWALPRYQASNEQTIYDDTIKSKRFLWWIELYVTSSQWTMWRWSSLVCLKVDSISWQVLNDPGVSSKQNAQKKVLNLKIHDDLSFLCNLFYLGLLNKHLN